MASRLQVGASSLTPIDAIEQQPQQVLGANYHKTLTSESSRARLLERGLDCARSNNPSRQADFRTR